MRPDLASRTPKILVGDNSKNPTNVSVKGLYEYICGVFRIIEWVNIFYFQFLKNLVNFLLQLNEMLSIIIGVPNRIAFLLI